MLVMIIESLPFIMKSWKRQDRETYDDDYEFVDYDKDGEKDD